MLPEWTSGYALAEGVDLLVHDAQYTDAEYATKVGWGHSTMNQALAFAKIAGVRHLALFHHDPERSDEMLERSFVEAVRDFEPEFKVSIAEEGVSVDFEIARTAQLATD
jgi:ribonuclease BN (tRNA processing enzyme)